MTDQHGLIANLVFIIALYMFIWVVTRNSFSFAISHGTKNNARSASQTHADETSGIAILKGSNGSIHKLDEEILLVGRSSNCQIRIADEFTSQHHATLRKAGFTWLVEDEQSTNGTFVNGKKIIKKTYINYGDTIIFGRTGFKLERG